MGLYNLLKNNNKYAKKASKYNITEVQKGESTDYSFTNKKDDKRLAKKISKMETPKVKEYIEQLKEDLAKEVKNHRNIGATYLKPGQKAERGVQKAGREAVHAAGAEKIRNIVSELERYDIKVNRDALKRGVILYEKGEFDMLTSKDIRTYKLEIFEENAAGNLSDELRDYMLCALESVSPIVGRYEEYLEAVNSKIEERRNHFVEFVKESYNVGLLNSRQMEVMYELAEDDYMFEGPSPEDIPGLVMNFIEAAKEGNYGLKEEITCLIDEAKALKQMRESVYDTENVFNEGADCSVVDKLESLKIKLTDEEKAMAEKFDEMIANAMEGESGEDDGEEPSDDGKDEGKKEDKKEEEKEGKSVNEYVEDRFTSVSMEGVNLSSKEEILDFMVEGVNNSLYTEEDYRRLETVLEKVGY